MAESDPLEATANYEAAADESPAPVVPAATDSAGVASRSLPNPYAICNIWDNPYASFARSRI